MKKTLIIAMSIVLIIAMSVAGTFAWLTAQSATPVTNTFVAGKYIAPNPDPNTPNQGLELKEHEVIDAAVSGEYTQNLDKEVMGNKYTVVPGAVIPKDPFVRVHFTDKPVASYLYVEVVDNTNEIIKFSADTTNWTLLSGVTGKNGGQVYAYREVVKANITDNLYFLKDNHVTVDANANVSSLTESGKALEFYAYMCQAAAGKSATEAFNASFSAP